MSFSSSARFCLKYTYRWAKSIFRKLDFQAKIHLKQAGSQLSGFVSLKSSAWACVVPEELPESLWVIEIKVFGWVETTIFCQAKALSVHKAQANVLFCKVARLQRESCKINVIFVETSSGFHGSYFREWTRTFPKSSCQC